MECKCYLSSRERHFVLCTGWSSLSKQSEVAPGDAVVFRRVGGGRFQVARIKGGAFEVTIWALALVASGPWERAAAVVPSSSRASSTR
jgi:hypothetical protein